jgi:hypothetical protein
MHEVFCGSRNPKEESVYGNEEHGCRVFSCVLDIAEVLRLSSELQWL